VIVDWTDEFDRWLTNAEEQVGKLPEVAVALLQALNDLPAKPDEEAPTFKRVRQARCYEPWRAAHPTTLTSPSGSSTGSLPTTKSCSRRPVRQGVHRGRVLRQRRGARRDHRRCLAAPEGELS
jgi:hypothetical protein